MRALVVGGSSGIGAATVELLRSCGHQVEEMSRTSGVDVSDTVGFTDALVNLGDVDHVVYSAGIVHPGNLEGLTFEELADQVAVNLTGAATCLRWWLRTRREGSMTLVSSTSGHRASPGWSIYGATKAALSSLGCSVAVEAAKRRQRVYVVAPGRCATALRAALAPDEDPDTIMQPTAVADVIHQLIADFAGVLAGQVIEVKNR